MLTEQSARTWAICLPCERRGGKSLAAGWLVAGAWLLAVLVRLALLVGLVHLVTT